MSFLINPFIQYPTTNPIGITVAATIRSGGNPGQSFTIGTAARTLNQFRIYFVTWESITNDIILNSMTWGGDSVQIIGQFNIGQGSSRGGIAVVKYRSPIAATAAASPIVLNFSNFVSAAALTGFNLLNNSSDTQFSLNSGIKDTSTTSLSILTPTPPQSMTFIGQINLTNGATSTLSSSVGISVTKNADAPVPATSSIFQTLSANMENVTNTNYNNNVIAINSNLTTAGAYTITFI